MRAVVFDRYGPPEVLQVREIERPDPRRQEVRVRVRATTVTPSDIMLRSGQFPPIFWLAARLRFGFVRPRSLTPAYELSGEIEAVGEGVDRFQVGDQVFGASMWAMSCSAEYITLPQTAPLVIKPANLSHQEAVTFVDGACTALHFLDRAGIQPGHRVLVHGASGSIGTAAVQLARHFGARVTGVCSTTNVELVMSLGAHEVIDYTRRDLTIEPGAYDVVFDTVGKLPLSAGLGLLAPRGVYLSTRMSTPARLRGAWITRTTDRRVVGGYSTSDTQKLERLKALIEARQLVPVIDRVYPLSDIAHAHRYVARGHKKGNVVIAV